MTVKRRTLLHAAWVAMTAPWWIARAFAASSSSTVEEVMAGWRRAQRAGRPLLVLVIPEAEERRYEHGSLLGAVLNHGSDATLAALAQTEVVCALPSQLRELVSGVGPSDDAWAVLVETDGVPATATVFGGMPPDPPVAAGDWEAVDRAEDAALQQRIDWASQGLVKLVQPDRATLVRRVAQARRADDALVDRVSRALVAGPPTVEQAAAAPAVLALAAVDAAPAVRVELVAALAGSARASLVEKRVPGSWWAVSGGCGTRIEGVEDQLMVKCGMGHVTARATRALHFWNPEAP